MKRGRAVQPELRSCKTKGGLQIDLDPEFRSVAYVKKSYRQSFLHSMLPIFILCVSTNLVFTLVDRVVMKTISQETGTLKKQSVISKLYASMTDDRHGT